MRKHVVLFECGIANSILKSSLRSTWIVCMLFLCSFNQSSAQSVSCNGHVNISLDENCEYVVSPKAVSSASMTDVDALGYSVMIEDGQGEIVPNATLTRDYLGQTLKVKLIRNNTSNSCWGTILVEDKMAPTVVCPDEPIRVPCHEFDGYTPEVEDNCDNAIAVKIGERLIKSDCDDDVLKTFEQIWVARDPDFPMFESEPCTLNVEILRIDTTNLGDYEFQWPADYEDNNALICQSFDVDDEGNPHVSVTGIPLYINTSVTPPDTLELYPDIPELCGARVEYDDTVIGRGGCLVKVMRLWSFYDECTDFDNIFDHVQFIQIADTVPPVILCPHPLTYATSGISCETVVKLPPATTTDNCSDVVRYEVIVATADSVYVPIDTVHHLAANGGNVILEAGKHVVSYIAFDGCGKSDTCTTTLEVVDSVPPIAVCDRHTVVGLTTNGIVEVSAEVFDDGSFDDCKLDRFEVRRMDEPLCVADDDKFGPTVTFCCADLPAPGEIKEIMVVFRVYDSNGRYNDCMVTVEVQDKTGPSIDCPADREIYCDYPINLDDLTEFGVATANNQCETELRELAPIVDINTCRIGKITRRWRASDGNGAVVCTQVITVKNPNDFSYDNMNDFIVFPRDTFIVSNSTCTNDLSPENLPDGYNKPVINDGPCDLLGATYKDELFTFDDGQGACLKILRKWTLINWCAPDGTLERYQTLKVNYTGTPTVTLGDNLDEICTQNNDCEEGEITLTASAVDDCNTGLIRNEALIDIDNNGTIDFTLSNLGTLVGTSTTSVTLVRTYPVGTHRVLFSFTNLCGNVSSEEHIFTIKNCKAPTAACIDGLSIALQAMDTDGDGQPDNEMACIWASDFDASSVHPCGYDVELFFDAAGTIREMCFDCCMIGENRINVYAVDEFGNYSFCETTVIVQDNNDVNFCNFNIIRPQNVTVENCNGDTSPTGTGSPTLGDGCECGVNNSEYVATSTETVTTNGEGCDVITRTWTVTCSGAVLETFNQVITVRNNKAPTISAPANITMNIGASTSCEVFVNVPLPTVNEGCNDAVTVTHNSTNADAAGRNASGTYPIGTSTITYVATNGCGQSNSSSFTIIVSDNVAPVCISMDTTLMIEADGTVTFDPTELDMNSTDPCGNVTVSTGDDITFTCDDVGTTQSVSYRITDPSGNSRFCSANVTIISSTELVCTSVDTFRLILDGTGNGTVVADNVDAGSMGVCGTDLTRTVTPDAFTCTDIGFVNYTLTVSDGTISCTSTGVIEIIDNSAPTIVAPSDRTISCGDDPTDVAIVGGVTLNDNCAVATVDTTIVSNLGTCNMGVITRTFIATDPSGNTASMTQIITVAGPTNPVTESNITWPTSPITVTECTDMAPSETEGGMPVVDASDAECSIITIEFNDVFTDPSQTAGGGCQGTITRTWTVTDSCQLTDGTTGIFTFDQIFNITDNDAPLITGATNFNIPLGIGDCETVVDLSFITVTDCDSDPVVTNNSMFATDSNSADASGTYPAGMHTITITATDFCGNTATDSYTINVVANTSNESFECIKKVFNLEDSDPPMVTVHIDSITNIIQAADCSTTNLITASFNPADVAELTRDYNCDQIADITTRLWFFRDGVVFDSCRILVTIADPNNFCTSNVISEGENEITGLIRTENGEGVQAVAIELDGSEMPIVTSGNDGHYAFPALPNGGNYTVKPEKNDDVLNGVSTLDLIMIQKHILGLKKLDSPYKMIAADINNSNSITVTDLVDLRKLILGVHDEFPNNNSWRTIDGSYEFSDENNPFSVDTPEEYEINQLDSDMNIDFIGIKVGDVNGTASPTNYKVSEIRSNNNLTFEIEAIPTSDNLVQYNFIATDYTDVKGFQVTLEFDRLLNFVKPQAGALAISSSNLGLKYLDRDAITMSYNELGESASIANGEVLFSLVFEAHDRVENAFSISDRITRSEAYTNELVGVELEFKDHDGGLLITELYQNNPNPWTAETFVEFNLPKAMNASINIYDVSGRALFKLTQPFDRGMNRVTITKDDLANYSGVAYYELITKDVKLTKTMLLIE